MTLTSGDLGSPVIRTRGPFRARGPQTMALSTLLRPRASKPLYCLRFLGRRPPNHCTVDVFRARGHKSIVPSSLFGPGAYVGAGSYAFLDMGKGRPSRLISPNSERLSPPPFFSSPFFLCTSKGGARQRHPEGGLRQRCFQECVVSHSLLMTPQEGGRQKNVVRVL